MNFTELCSEVYTITNRSDLVAETELAVKSATLKAHSSDFYFKDLRETIISFDSAAYIQSLDYRTLFPKYRSLKYLKKFDTTSNETVEPPLEVLPPELLIDSYGDRKTNVAYVAGSVIQIKSSTEEQHYSIGIYQHPTVESVDTYASWIATEYPYCIIFEAAAIVFGLQGDATRQAAYRTQALEMYAELRGSNLVAVGY